MTIAPWSIILRCKFRFRSIKLFGNGHETGSPSFHTISVSWRRKSALDRSWELRTLVKTPIIPLHPPHQHPIPIPIHRLIIMHLRDCGMHSERSSAIIINNGYQNYCAPGLFIGHVLFAPGSVGIGLPVRWGRGSGGGDETVKGEMSKNTWLDFLYCKQKGKLFVTMYKASKSK